MIGALRGIFLIEEHVAAGVGAQGLQSLSAGGRAFVVVDQFKGELSCRRHGTVQPLCSDERCNGRPGLVGICIGRGDGSLGSHGIRDVFKFKGPAGGDGLPELIGDPCGDILRGEGLTCLEGEFIDAGLNCRSVRACDLKIHGLFSLLRIGERSRGAAGIRLLTGVSVGKGHGDLLRQVFAHQRKGEGEGNIAVGLLLAPFGQLGHRYAAGLKGIDEDGQIRCLRDLFVGLFPIYFGLLHRHVGLGHRQGPVAVVRDGELHPLEGIVIDDPGVGAGLFPYDIEICAAHIRLVEGKLVKGDGACLIALFGLEHDEAALGVFAEKLELEGTVVSELAAPDLLPGLEPDGARGMILVAEYDSVLFVFGIFDLGPVSLEVFGDAGHGPVAVVGHGDLNGVGVLIVGIAGLFPVHLSYLICEGPAVVLLIVGQSAEPGAAVGLRRSVADHLSIGVRTVRHVHQFKAELVAGHLPAFEGLIEGNGLAPLGLIAVGEAGSDGLFVDGAGPDGPGGGGAGDHGEARGLGFGDLVAGLGGDTDDGDMLSALQGEGIAVADQEGLYDLSVPAVSQGLVLLGNVLTVGILEHQGEGEFLVLGVLRGAFRGLGDHQVAEGPVPVGDGDVAGGWILLVGIEVPVDRLLLDGVFDLVLPAAEAFGVGVFGKAAEAPCPVPIAVGLYGHGLSGEHAVRLEAHRDGIGPVGLVLVGVVPFPGLLELQRGLLGHVGIGDGDLLALAVGGLGIALQAEGRIGVGGLLFEGIVYPVPVVIVANHMGEDPCPVVLAAEGQGPVGIHGTSVGEQTDGDRVGTPAVGVPRVIPDLFHL